MRMAPEGPTAVAMRAQIARGNLTPTLAVEQALERIEAQDDRLNAFVTVTAESARERAARLEERESDGPLYGVPVAIKDLGDMKAGVRHTLGSKVIADLGFEAPTTSAAVERLEAAGAIVVGTTNVPELGHKGTTTNELIGSTASPVDHRLNAGGSSGGSAAAVGAGMVPIALGSDAGGSIRIPAAACGVVGFKPSFGLVPQNSRPNAFGRSIHHTVTGPITRTVEDAAIALHVLAGPHPRDPASVPVDIDYLDALDVDPETLSIGFSPALDAFSIDNDVMRVVDSAMEDLRGAGASVERVDLGHGLEMTDLRDAVRTTFASAIVGGIETIAAEYGLDLRDHPEDVSDTLLELAAIGEGQAVTDLALTGIVRTRIFDAIQDILADHDVLIAPTLAVTGIGRDEEIGVDAWDMALTWPFNWTGHPVASVPAGRTDAGHPVGLQIVGQRYADDAVLGASAAFESTRPWDLP